MSIKIYNGIILKNKNLNETLPLILKIRKKCEEIKKRKEESLYINLMTKILDNQKINMESPKEICKRYELPKFKQITPILAAEIIIKNRIKNIKLKNERDPAVDFECNISLIPSGNDTLGTIFTECSEMTEHILKLEEIEEYNYWDNTDKPENISEKIWEKRYSKWKEATNFKAPSESGLTAEITSINSNIHNISFKNAPQEKLSVIIKRHIESAIYDEYYKNTTNKDSNIWKIMKEAVKWGKTEEGRAFSNLKTKELQEILPETYSHLDFYKNL